MPIIADGLPLTGYVDLAKASATDVRAAIGKLCREELHTEEKVAEDPKAARSFDDAIGLLDPAADQLMRCVVLNTSKAGWIGVYYNVVGGYTLAAFLANRLKTDTVGVRLDADTATRKGRTFQGTFGAVRMDVYGADGKLARSLAAWNDLGKWRFGERGKALPFENTRAYKAASARDRFTSTMLVQYLAKLGLRPFDEDFFVVDARHPAQSVTVTWRSEENEPISLADLRKQSGLTQDIIAALLDSGASTPKRPRRKD